MNKFNADISKVLDIFIHSLYKDKDVFLRELISNASDACEKRRFKLLSTGEAFEGMIKIDIDEANKKIKISDNGIGMNEEELHKSLSTLGASNSEILKSENKNLEDIIGQFGVGFYSCFIVAEEVEVITKQEQEAFLWKSNGKEGYSIEKTTKEDIGTEIILTLKEEHKEYLNYFTIENIIKTYSSNINYPILIKDNENVNKIINPSPRIWRKNKNDITSDEYKHFYKSCHSSEDDPYINMHSKIEGDIEFYTLLFAPLHKPFDLFNPDRLCKVKLYSRGVYIPDENVDIIPKYLRFFHGVVDSNDLPLNVSRDSIQTSGVMRKMKKAITNKLLSQIKSLISEDPKKYDEFWTKYGIVLKEGLCEQDSDREKLLELMKIETNKTQEQKKTLKEYIDGMLEKQDKIFYAIGANEEDIRNMPEMEKLEKEGYEIIFFTDPVDAFWLSVNKTYADKTFQSIKDVDLDIKSTINEDKKDEEENLLELFKNALSDKVMAVKITNKLTDSPACISLKGDGIDIRMERMLYEQKQILHRRPKILEINPEHKLILQTRDMLKEKNAKGVDMANIIFELALVSSGEIPDSPAKLVKNIYKCFAGEEDNA